LNIDNSPTSAAAVLYDRCGDTISEPRDSRTDQTTTVPAEAVGLFEAICTARSMHRLTVDPVPNDSKNP
jgi:hypothetical protein